MSEPEIARRCSACGASIRERAFFCPQCGSPVGDKTEELRRTETINTTNTINLTEAQEHGEAVDLNSSEHVANDSNVTRRFEQTITEPLPAPALDPAESVQPDLHDTIAEPSLPTQPVSRPAEMPHSLESPTRQRLQRAAAGAKAFEGDVVQRVDRLKKISSVVIDQASYDPSLRFILVAAAMFVVFLTIVILSKLIG